MCVCVCVCVCVCAGLRNPLADFAAVSRLPLSVIKSCAPSLACCVVSQCAQISKHAGGIGLSIHHVRAANSYIRGTNGSSNGIVPMLRVFNNTARYVDQVCLRADSV